MDHALKEQKPGPAHINARNVFLAWPLDARGQEEAWAAGRDNARASSDRHSRRW